MKRLFVWGTLRHNGVNNPFFLVNAKLVNKNFVFEDASEDYMKIGDVYEVGEGEFSAIHRFEGGFNYVLKYTEKYNFYYYVGAEVSPTGMWI